MDFVLGLPHMQSSVNSIFIIVDWFSKMAHFIAYKKTLDAAKTAQLFFNEVYGLLGLLNSIVFYKNTHFLSHFWKSLWRLVNIKLSFSIASHP